MKRMRDYSKYPLDRLQQKAAHIRGVILRLEAKGYRCPANKLVLAEVERQIAAKYAPLQDTETKA